jgi:2-polyprenyl-3-methyl-5-hydroxy-6-metoxy-1,4-benzoquinol methylase
METVGCLFSHQAPPELAFEVPDRLGEAGELFRILRCSGCGLLYLSPRPEITEIGQYYPFEEYQQEFSQAVEDETSRWRRWNRRYSLAKLSRFVNTVAAGGRLLDVGCGTGNFLAYMREQGTREVCGLDTNWQAVEYAHNRLDLQVFHGTIEDAHYSSASFHVVTMWNVLEHLHNPPQVLQEARRVLRSDGILALSIPNGASLDARLFGPRWIGLDPPRHLYTFTRQTLQRLLAQTGFEMFRLQHITGSYHSFVASLQLCIQHIRCLPNGPMRHILSTVVSSSAAHVLALPYLRLTEGLGRGAILSVLARPV